MRFRQDTTGTLEFYPPEKAVPSSATVTLRHPGGSELQASASATIDSVATTLAAAASRGDRLVSVASATGITRGDRYLVATDGDAAVLRVARVDGTDIYLSTPLEFDLDSGSAFSGYKLSYSLTTTHTDTRADNYVAAWAYTADGEARYREQTWDVIDETGWYPTTMNDVVEEYDNLPDVLKPHQFDGDMLLRNAWDKHVVPMLRAAHIDDARIKNKERLIPLHCALVNWVVLKSRAYVSSDVRGDEADRAYADVEMQHSRLMADLGWYDDDSDGQVDETETGTIRTGIRITR